MFIEQIISNKLTLLKKIVSCGKKKVIFMIKTQKKSSKIFTPGLFSGFILQSVKIKLKTFLM